MLKLDNIYEAKFISRLNRFVGEGQLKNGKKIKFHIGDTGRLSELLKEGNDILIQNLGNFGGRKYSFRLLAAKNVIGDWVLLNSLMHSQLVELYLMKKGYKYKKEVVLGDSRIDFLIYENGYDNLVEVKGCSLMVEKKKILDKGFKNLIRTGFNYPGYINFVGMFPDAPTKRGTKHLNNLINIKKFDSSKKISLRFLLLNPVAYFYPNIFTDKEFTKAFFKFLKIGGNLKFLYIKLAYIPTITFAGHITISVHESL